MCNGDCKNCNKEEIKEVTETLKTDILYALRTQVDTDAIPVGSKAQIMIGKNLILTVTILSAIDVGIELNELGD